MSDAVFWWVIVGVVVAVELVTGTFYLLMLGLGMAGAAVAAHLGLGFSGQLAVAGVLGSVLVALWHTWRRRRARQTPATNAEGSLDVGHTVHVDDWDAEGQAEVRYRGAQWQAVRHGPDAGPGSYRIRSVDGARLVLEK